MSAQQLLTPDGKKFILLPEEEYLILIRDWDEKDEIDKFKERVAMGKEELIPAETVYRLMDGENRIRVWREYRKMTMADLAEKIGIKQPYLSQLETGTREGTLKLYKKLAKALGRSIDDLVGRERDEYEEDIDDDDEETVIALEQIPQPEAQIPARR